MIDPKFFNFVSQMSHAFLGSTIVLGTLLLWPTHLTAVLVAYALITALKEFWYDYHYEDAITRGSSLLDFVCYQAGAYGALLLWFLLAKG